MSQVNLRRFAILWILAIISPSFGDLQSDVASIVAATDLHKGNAGICIIDTGKNNVLVEINASKGMIPASNQKLLTTGAALHVLGSDFLFQTKLLRNGDDVILVGDGDPTFGDMELAGLKEWNNERHMLALELKPWVEAIKKSGIKDIKTLWVDDRIFDQSFIHPSWPSNQINNWYCAQVSGLNYHLNVFHFFPSPNRGSVASLGQYTPIMPWLSITNRTTSKTSKKDKSSFWVARSPNSNKITAKGNVKSTHTVPVRVAFHDAAMVLGETLAATLRLHNIKVGIVSHVSSADPPSTGELLFLRETPLALALARSNQDSHNLYAESILKRLAASATQRPGTFDEGSEVVRSVVEQRIGALQTGLMPADGSGMSRDNRVSPKTLAHWLATFQLDEPTGKAFVHSLATPGIGTLDNRFTQVKLDGATVYAKSGYIRGVCALSGYIVFDMDKAPIVFSILVNDVKGTVRNAKTMQEQIIACTIQSVLD